MLGHKRFFRSLLAILTLALTFTYAQPVSAALTIPLVNADFEDSPLANGGAETGVDGWFDRFFSFAAFRFRLDTAFAGETDSQGGLTSGAIGAGNEGYIYNPIGTFDDNEQVRVTMDVLRRSGFGFQDFTVSLWSGNVTGADTSSLATLGATQLTTTTITAASMGFGTGTPGESGSFLVDFDTGTTGVVGETLWLELRAISDGGAEEAYFDNIVVANTPVVPEPSSFMALGALGLVGLGIRIRRRRKQV